MTQPSQLFELSKLFITTITDGFATEGVFESRFCMIVSKIGAEVATALSIKINIYI